MIDWTQFGFFTLWMMSFSVLALRYSVFAGLAFYLIQVLLFQRKNISRLRKDPFSRYYMWLDIQRSLLSFFIFGAMMALIVILRREGLTAMYTNWSDRSWIYGIASFFILMGIHDTYFYWMHRLLHTKSLYRLIHRHHHRPTPPTPFTSFAFHPLEAIAEFIFIIPVVFVLPLHPLTLFLFANIMTAMNVWGHLGVELLPAKFFNSIGAKILNTTTHHDMHHQFNKCNYGLYFNLWDSFMKTNHVKYGTKYKKNSANDCG